MTHVPKTWVASGAGYGAIGGAVSAMTANSIATAATGGQGITDQGQLAAIVTATSLPGGAAAGSLGQTRLQDRRDTRSKSGSA